jgi:hypothetical protein
MYYTGNDFESAKEYKTLDGAKKAADKNGMNVYDEDAVQIYPEPVEGSEGEQQEEETAAVGETAQEQEGGQQQETPDEKPAEEQEVQEQEPAGIKEESVTGVIRRVFDGKLRLHRAPSFSSDTVCGVTKFDERRVTQKATTPEGVMYKTASGYYVSGRPEHVEFIAD